MRPALGGEAGMDGEAPAARGASRDLALRLTALLILLRPLGGWAIRPAMLGIGVLALLLPRVLRHALTWLALAVLIGLVVVVAWPLADNHIYLLAYWCLAAAIALRRAAPPDALATAARWLLGLSFACAVAWKALLSPDYLDGGRVPPRAVLCRGPVGRAARDDRTPLSLATFVRGFCALAWTRRTTLRDYRASSAPDRERRLNDSDHDDC